MSLLKTWVFGKPCDPRDPKLFQKLSLIAFLAWVGLGADGLSSSSYGPDEAYRALLGHEELAVAVALATMATVFVISLAYSKLIEHFPNGGGGYVVATKLLGPNFGVVSGCALLVDYVLTITTSLASATDQIFSFLPLPWHAYKLPVEALLIAVLVVLNLRGVKETVELVVPMFLLFLITHAVALIGCAVVFHARALPQAEWMARQLQNDYHQIGLLGLFALFLSAFSRGAGTYTGIEAVSNAVPIMREPKVHTAKKTMLYMAFSLALTAGGILFCYLLSGVSAEEGKTLNAALYERLGFGHWFTVLILLTEGGLLVVAAQTGFIDGPRVMANMALDGWFPRRFSSLSEQFTIHQGVILMGLASLATLVYTRGNITALVIMYSINVFVTFSLSQLGMCRYWWQKRRDAADWKRPISLHLLALLLCAGILSALVFEKFYQGAWMTLAVTSSLIGLCFLVQRHYRKIQEKIIQLSAILNELPRAEKPAENPGVINPKEPVAVLLVGGYSGLGIHSLLTILKQFPRHFKQIIFASAAVMDSGSFKGVDEVERLQQETEKSLQKYVAYAQRLGLAAVYQSELGTDPVAVSENLCLAIARQYRHAVFFGGKLVFRRDTYLQRLLHNETATAIQRRLQWQGIPMVVLPICVRE